MVTNTPASCDGGRGFLPLKIFLTSGKLFCCITTGCLLLILLPFTCQSASIGASQIPDWYLESSGARNEVTAMGNTQLEALLNGLGNLTENLDPNVKKMREAYGDKLTEKSTRMLAQYEFGNLEVSTQTENYRKITRRDEYRTFQQKMVRVQFPAADTVSKVYYYVEELRGGINSVCNAHPDTLPEETVTKILRGHFEGANLQVKRFEQGGRKHDEKYFILLRYVPANDREKSEQQKRN